MKRTAEFILGLIGGCLFSLIALIGFIGAILYGSEPFSILSTSGEEAVVVSSAVIVLLLSLLGLFGAIFVNRKNTLSGILMLVSGVVGLAASGFPWSALWALPLIVAGVMACVPKDEKPRGQNTAIQ